MPIERKGIVALVAGMLAGFLDMILIIFSEPASGWTLLQVFLAWTICGFVVVVMDTRLNRFLHGIMLTVAINLPWYVLYGPGAGHAFLVVPLVIMSVVFGAGFALAHGYARR